MNVLVLLACLSFLVGWSDIFGLDMEANEDSKGFEESTARVNALIKVELDKGIPSNKILLGGFSQGKLTYNQPSIFLLMQSFYVSNNHLSLSLPLSLYLSTFVYYHLSYVLNYPTGGALALHVALRSPLTLGGCVALSSWLPFRKDFPAALSPTAKSLPIFQVRYILKY